MGVWSSPWNEAGGPLPRPQRRGRLTLHHRPRDVCYTPKGVAIFLVNLTVQGGWLPHRRVGDRATFLLDMSVAERAWGIHDNVPIVRFARLNVN